MKSTNVYVEVTAHLRKDLETSCYGYEIRAGGHILARRLSPGFAYIALRAIYESVVHAIKTPKFHVILSRRIAPRIASTLSLGEIRAIPDKSVAEGLEMLLDDPSDLRKYVIERPPIENW